MANDLTLAMQFNHSFHWENETGLPKYTPDLVGTFIRGKEVLPHGPNELGTVAWQLDAGVALTPHKGVITFAFPDSTVKGGIYNSPHWDAIYNFYDAPGYTPFTQAQRVGARQSIQNWDDLIAPTFKEVNGAGAADITFQNTYTNMPGEGAHAYYPYDFGYRASKHVESDVWTNDPRVDPSLLQLYPGGYGMQAVNHEIGHTLGLSHPGNYNATDDNDGDGVPDPITYQNDAFYFQDSQQYTIMSYFDSYETGAQPIDWSVLRLMYPSTPMVDDVYVIQQKYGADMTTRAGDTTYGFNATADVKNEAMSFHTGDASTIFTIWDAGGKDTLDLSGYYTDSVIDLRQGAYSSAGGWGAYDPAVAGTDPSTMDHAAALAIIDANNAAAGLGPRTLTGANADLLGSDYYYKLYFEGHLPARNADGTPAVDENGNPIYLNEGLAWKDITGSDDGHYLMEQNIGIAYGAIVENAIGGHGDDRINGNEANNFFTGGDGDDTFIIADYDGEAAGKAIVDNSIDTITDFHTGEDKIDLTSFGSDVSNLDYSHGDLHFTANHHDYTVHLMSAELNLNNDILLG